MERLRGAQEEEEVTSTCLVTLEADMCHDLLHVQAMQLKRATEGLERMKGDLIGLRDGK